MDSHSSESKGSILVVDDTAANLRLLTSILKNEGYEVRPVPNGKLALSAAQGLPPDLILLDIKMPDLNGFKVCEQLKAHEKTQEIPIIFISALDDIEDKVKAFSAGGVDYVTKPFQAAEVLARVQTHLELKFSREKLQESYEIIKDHQDQLEMELERGRQTQQMLLPKKIPQIPGTKISTKYLPIDKIGGDFFDIFELGDERYGFMIADVVGHGISAALLSFMVSGLFRNTVSNASSTVSVLRFMNQALEREFPDGMFVSMFYGILDSKTGHFRYTNGGHTPVLVINSEGHLVEELTTYSSLVGMFADDISKFGEKTLTLNAGDRMLFYTDGLVEVMNEHYEQFGEKRLGTLLRKHYQMPIGPLVDKLVEESLDFAKNKQFHDDCTVIAMEMV